ncbi:hypothetical protein O181_005098 [Austropuccinia psidii MF-1]|uniref:UFSP1/2/DUB catalytic domain-containing protein n=1 Tax=Austropuccinia psidii MF-1 TaxID=1389203 RepID=A0A9Q3GF75_9BASI|nr:hypothetical protein [Austropuccinia psidii MF-1]
MIIQTKTLKVHPQQEEPEQNSKLINPRHQPGTAFIPIILRHLLIQSVSSPSNHSAILSTHHVLHIRSTTSKTALGDRDWMWGCGYRNIQMVFSAIRHRPNYSSLLANHPLLTANFNPKGSSSLQTHHQTFHSPQLAQIPSISTLQHLIEDAWRAGFDPEGAADFGGSLINKKKWIGTTEAFVALARLGIRVRIVDFPQPSGPDGLHIKLFEWVQNYFSSPELAFGDHGSDSQLMSKDCRIKLTHKLPLYFQHSGHSRTIIGVETDNQGIQNFLILDPAKSISTPIKTASQLIRSIADSNSSASSFELADLFGRSLPVPQVSSPSNSYLSSKRVKSIVGSFQASFGSTLHPELLSPYRISLKALSRKRQYQILCVDDALPIPPQEQVNWHIIRSTRIE